MSKFFTREELKEIVNRARAVRTQYRYDDTQFALLTNLMLAADSIDAFLVRNQLGADIVTPGDAEHMKEVMKKLDVKELINTATETAGYMAEYERQLNEAVKGHTNGS